MPSRGMRACEQVSNLSVKAKGGHGSTDAYATAWHVGNLSVSEKAPEKPKDPFDDLFGGDMPPAPPAAAAGLLSCLVLLFPYDAVRQKRG
eukprot:2875416-Rhodomonas_salina.1